MSFSPRSVTVQRQLKRKVNQKVTQSQIEYLVTRAFGAGRGDTWSVSIGKISQHSSKGIVTTRCKLTFVKKSGRKNAEHAQWEHILKFIVDAGAGTRFNTMPWRVFKGDSNKVVEFDQEETNDVIGQLTTPKFAKEYDYGDLLVDPGDHFNHIYNRDDQIYMVMRRLHLAQQTGLAKRHHAVLHGPPGSGKTEILRAVRNMMGEDNVLQIDATSTSAAGVIKKMLDKRSVIPPLVQIEEVEKRDQADLNWLLGATDTRGEVRKLNFFVNDHRHVRFICLMTVNDMDEFRKKCKGALASRFWAIYCPHPNRDTMGKILTREISQIDGKSSWVEPTLELCFDGFGWTDPRNLIDVCLCGQDDLLSGIYQKGILSTVDENDFDDPNRIKDLKSKYKVI